MGLGNAKILYTPLKTLIFILVKNKDLIKQLGNRIRAIREGKGLTQFDVSVIANTDNKHISRIELGQVDAQISTIEKIAVCFGISLKDLFDFDLEIKAVDGTGQKPDKEG